MRNSKTIKIDHVNETIIMTKKYYDAACCLNSPEYKELMIARRENPTFKMEVRTITKASNKNTYLNLTVENMRFFVANSKISEQPVEERLTEFDSIAALSKIYPSPYSYIKSWFLKNYGDEYNQYRDKNEDVNDETVQEPAA